MKEIAFAFDGRNGRVEVGLDVKGICSGATTEMTPSEHERRGAQFAREFMIQTALRKHFGTPRNAARALGLDERIVDDISTSTEYETMPYPHRRAGDTSRIRSLGADRRRLRAQDEGEDPVEYLRELIQGLDPEDAQALIQSLGGDRRLGRDQPPPFPGRPNPGGEMDPLARWREPGETRQHAADRRRYAHDEASDRHGYGRKGFLERFPGAAHIKTM